MDPPVRQEAPELDESEFRKSAYFAYLRRKRGHPPRPGDDAFLAYYDAEEAAKRLEEGASPPSADGAGGPLPAPAEGASPPSADGAGEPLPAPAEGASPPSFAGEPHLAPNALSFAHDSKDTAAVAGAQEYTAVISPELDESEFRKSAYFAYLRRKRGHPPRPGDDAFLAYYDAEEAAKRLEEGASPPSAAGAGEPLPTLPSSYPFPTDCLIGNYIGTSLVFWTTVPFKGRLYRMFIAWYPSVNRLTLWHQWAGCDTAGFVASSDSATVTASHDVHHFMTTISFSASEAHQTVRCDLRPPLEVPLHQPRPSDSPLDSDAHAALVSQSDDGRTAVAPIDGCDNLVAALRMLRSCIDAFGSRLPYSAMFNAPDRLAAVPQLRVARINGAHVTWGGSEALSSTIDNGDHQVNSIAAILEGMARLVPKGLLQAQNRLPCVSVTFLELEARHHREFCYARADAGCDASPSQLWARPRNVHSAATPKNERMPSSPLSEEHLAPCDYGAQLSNTADGSLVARSISPAQEVFVYAADKTSADAASNDLSGGSHGVAPIEIARSESAHQPVLSVCIEEHAVPIIVASDAATGEARWWHPLQGPCSGLFALHSTALVFSDLRRGRLRLLQLLPGPTPSSAPEATSHSAFVEGLGCIACDLASGTVFVSARRRVRGQRGPVAVVLAYAVLSGRLVEQGIVSGAGDSRSDRVLVVMPPSSDGSTAARLVIGDGESFSLIVLALPQRSFVQTIECRSPSGTRGGGVMSLAIARDGSLLVSHAGGVSCLAWPPIDSRCPPADPETVATSRVLHFGSTLPAGTTPISATHVLSCAIASAAIPPDRSLGSPITTNIHSTSASASQASISPVRAFTAAATLLSPIRSASFLASESLQTAGRGAPSVPTASAAVRLPREVSLCGSAGEIGAAFCTAGRNGTGRRLGENRRLQQRVDAPFDEDEAMDLLQRQCDSDELGLRNAELPIRASSSVFASLSIKDSGHPTVTVTSPNQERRGISELLTTTAATMIANFDTDGSAPASIALRVVAQVVESLDETVAGRTRAQQRRLQKGAWDSTSSTGSLTRSLRSAGVAIAGRGVTVIGIRANACSCTDDCASVAACASEPEQMILLSRISNDSPTVVSTAATSPLPVVAVPPAASLSCTVESEAFALDVSDPDLLFHFLRMWLQDPAHRESGLTCMQADFRAAVFVWLKSYPKWVAQITAIRARGECDDPPAWAGRGVVTGLCGTLNAAGFSVQTRAVAKKGNVLEIDGAAWILCLATAKPTWNSNLP